MPEETLGFLRHSQITIGTWGLHQTSACGVQHTIYVRKTPKVSPSTKCLISRRTRILDTGRRCPKRRPAEHAQNTTLAKTTTDTLPTPRLETAKTAGPQRIRSIFLPKHGNATTASRYSTARVCGKPVGPNALAVGRPSNGLNIER